MVVLALFYSAGSPDLHLMVSSSTINLVMNFFLRPDSAVIYPHESSTTDSVRAGGARASRHH